MGDPSPSASGVLPRAVAFLSRPEVMVAGVTVTFATAAAEVLAPGGSSAMNWARYVLENNVIWIASVRATERYIILPYFFPKSVINSKCIDTSPSSRQPANVSTWGLSAADVAKTYSANLLGYAAISAYYCAADVAMSHASVLLCALPYAAGLTRFAGGIRRWNNVLSGKWQITDRGPPPEPVRRTAPSTAVVMARLAL